jgi:hypothetical protein
VASKKTVTIPEYCWALAKKRAIDERKCLAEVLEAAILQYLKPSKPAGDSHV